MNVKEIAIAVNKDETSVRRWIKKLTGKLPVRKGILSDILPVRNSINEKSSLSSPEKPADYDLEETCLIIEQGLGKNASALFKANATSAKMAQVNDILSLRDMEIIKTVVSTLINETIKKPEEQKKIPVLSEIKELEIIDEGENTVIVKWHREKYVATNNCSVLWNVCHYRDDGSGFCPLIKQGLYSKYKALEWIKRNL